MNRLLIALALAAVTWSGETPAASTGTAAAQVRAATGAAAFRQGHHERALAHFRRAAAAGHAVAQFNLAVMLMEGQGTAPRPAEAIGWLRKSAENGFVQAQDALAALLERGEHVPRSQSEATHWWRRARPAARRRSRPGPSRRSR